MARKVLALFGGATMVLLALASGRAAEYNWKLGHVAQVDNPYHVGSVKFAEAVAQKSNGRIEVKVFPLSQLGNERDMTENVQIGTIQLAVLANAPLGRIVPEAQLFDLPFIIRDDAHMRKVLDGSIGQEIRNLFPPKGLRLLAYFDFGYRYPYNRVGPMNHLADFQGRKFRTMESPTHIAIYNAMGARAVPMQSAEQYTALQQGVVDGSDNPLVFYWSQKHYEVAPYLTYGFGPLKGLAWLALSEKVYQGLPADLKKAVDDAAAFAQEQEIKAFKEQEAHLLAQLKAKGVKVTTVSDEEKAKFIESVKKVWKEFEPAVGKQRIEAVVNLK